MTDPRPSPFVRGLTLNVPAAASSVLDTAREFEIVADMGSRGGEQEITLRALHARGVLSTDLDITIRGGNWEDVPVLLPPSLYLDNLNLAGLAPAGFTIAVRNKRQSAVSLVAIVEGLSKVGRTNTLAGAAITTPLSDVGARPDYYDRNASDVSLNWNTGGAAPHAATTRATYTVPAGKKALVESAVVYLQRLVAQTSIGLASLSASVWSAGGAFLYNVAMVASYTGSGYQPPEKEHQSNIGVLFAGEVLKLISVDYGTGGTVAYDGSVKVVEMDA